jgi:pimeloyl-ACP methyl ester carboxylesterase
MAEHQTQLVDVRGNKIQLERGGDGPPFVFLHSALGEAWWSPWCDAVAETHTVYVPAHPGFGESEGLDDISDIEDLAFHYDELFAELRVERPVLAGQSLGGWIAVEYAVRWPDKVGGLVLIDAAGLRVEEAPAVDMWAVRPPELADLMFADHGQPLYQMMKAFEPGNPPPPEVLIPFFKAQQATARVAWNPYLHNPKLPGRLHRVACPTLVVWGERDGLIPPPHGQRYAELIAGARLVTMPETGHLPSIEQPDDLAKLLTTFLGSK